MNASGLSLISGNVSGIHRTDICAKGGDKALTAKPYTLDDPETMALREGAPAAVVRLLDAAQIKAEAVRMLRGGDDPGDWWERSILSYRALARYLDVPDGTDRTGLSLPNGEAVSCAAQHYDSIKAFDPVMAFWPVTDDPRDWLVAAYVRSNDDGSSSVALWGAMSGDEVRRRVKAGPVYAGRRPIDAATAPPRKGILTKRQTPFIRIPLRDFSRSLLDRLRVS